MTTALARRDIQLDRYIAEVTKHPLLSREEELALARSYRDHGDVAAAHKLVVSNLRFVVKVANEYRGYGMRSLDLIQEGNIGLMQAVKKFDPEKGYRLISYAVWWIRAHMQQFIMRTWSLVKLGSGRIRRHLFFKLRSAKSKMEQDNAGESPVDNAELAAELGVTNAEIDEMEARMAAHDFSLDAPIAADAHTTHLDLLAEDEDQEDALVAQEEQKMLAAAVDATRGALNDKERFILDQRLLADEPLTLAEVGEKFGVTRERARQLEARLIGKLRKAMPQKSPLKQLRAAVSP